MENTYRPIRDWLTETLLGSFGKLYIGLGHQAYSLPIPEAGE